MHESLPWILFTGFVVGMLALDLGVFHRSAHVVSRREAAGWSAFWIGLALLFNVGVFWQMGTDAGIQWTTGYLIEKSLSVDNVFVFLIIFAAFRVPPEYQHRVLFWGVLGALVMRAGMIALGVTLLETFDWIIYVFGTLLVVTGIRIFRSRGDEPDVGHNLFVRATRRWFNVTEGYRGQRFIVREAGTWALTPLALVLIVIETTDVVFAVDSIPAIFAVTRDPFIVYTSNVFAILGLRALFFLLAGYLNELPLLKPALAAILLFVGGKMLLADVGHLPPLVSLAVVAGILSVAVVLSLRMRPVPTAEQAAVPVVGGPFNPEDDEGDADRK